MRPTDDQRTTPGNEEAVRAYRASMSRRAKLLMELREWAETTQYHGLPNWFDEECNRPLLERAPCIAYPAADAAIESNVDLLLGEGRFPELRVQLDEEELSKAGAKVVTSVDDEDEGSEGDDDERQEAHVYAEDALRKLVRAARLKASARMAFREAQMASSVAAVFRLRDGVPYIDVIRAEWCTPKFTTGKSGALESLEIRYPYLSDEQGPNGETRKVCRIYRRVIDSQRDVTYLPGEASASGVEPRWVEDPAQSVKHVLGFCPAIWYAHMRECDTVDRIDGHAIHERCIDEIHALDVALSLRHKAAVTLGAPTVWETGVEPGDGPGGNARGYDPARDPTAIVSTLQGGVASHANPVNGYFATPPKHGARKLGPAALWSYTGPNVKVGLLSLSEGSLKALDEHCADLKIKVAESLSVVFLDPNNLKFASTTSGKALESLKRRQLDRCDQYRDDFWEGWLLPAVDMLLRIAVRTAEVLSKKLQPLVPTFAQLRAAEIEPEWGPYFPETVEDKKATLEVVKSARDLKLLSRRRALEIVGRLLGVTDFDAEEDAIEAEDEEDRERQREDADRQSHTLHAAMKLGAQSDDADDEDDDDNGSPTDPGAGEGAGQGQAGDAPAGGRPGRGAARRLGKSSKPPRD